MARTAPVPNIPAIPGMNPGLFVLGGGGDGGGSGAGSGKGRGGKQGASGKNGGKDAAGDGKTAPDPKKYPHCGTASHPVDVATGRAYTHPIVIAELTGPLPLTWTRSYSTSAAHQDVGLGFGWAHSLGMRVEERRRSLVVWTELGTAVSFDEKPAVGHAALTRFGYRIERLQHGFVLDPNDGRFYRFTARADDFTWLLTSIEDRNGNRIALSYEGASLSEVTDSAGRSIRLRRDNAGHIVTILRKNAITSGQWIALESYDYDQDGCLIRAVDADGFSSRYAYDEDHLLTLDEDRAGLCFHFVYDPEGRCIESWGDYGSRPDPSLGDGSDIPSVLASGGYRAKGVHHCVFEYLPQLTNVIDSTFVRVYEHNDFGLLTSAADTGPVPMRAVYDENGFLLRQESPDGGVSEEKHDERGNLLFHRDPLGHTTQIARDSNGLPISIIDGSGAETKIERDHRGNITRTVDPVGRSTSYVVGPRGLVVERVTPNGAITRFAYDDHANLTRIEMPNGGAFQLVYDAAGRVISVTDPLGAVTSYAYSNRGDLISVHDPTGGITRYRYDGERRLIGMQDANGHLTEYIWGGYHRFCGYKDPTGRLVTLRYTREGELIALRLPGGEEHRNTYDIFGRLVEERTIDGRILQYRLDAMGRAEKILRGDVAAYGGEPALSVVSFKYDLNGNVEERTFEDGAETFVYDAAGRLIEAHGKDASVTFAYDAAGHLIAQSQSFGAEKYVIETEYDALGERAARRTSLGHEEVITRNASGHRVRTRLDGASEILHETDALGRELERILPGGGRISTALDALGRVTGRKAMSGATPTRDPHDAPAWVGERPDGLTAHIAYLHDAAGQLIEKHDRARGRTEYGYDPVGQLVSAVPEKARREVFRYDMAGNLHEGDGGPARTYASASRLVRKGDVEYVWDARGRLVEKRKHRTGEEPLVFRYGWTESDMLARVDLPTGERIELEYDPLARRSKKRILAREGGVGPLRPVREQRFVWDGDVLVHEIVRDLTNKAAREGDPVTEVRTYCFEDGSWAPLLHKEADGRWAHYMTDAAGAPERLVSDFGDVLCTWERSAWGKVEIDAGARTTSPIRFQGQYEDTETGLCYNRYRYYDPDTGRFISPDPLGLSGGENAYAAPPSFHSWIDPLGLAPTTSRKGAIKAAGLPTTGRVRYVPPANWNPPAPLPRGRQNGYMDKFGNEWVRGPSRTCGEPYEWDVQLSNQGRAQLGWASRDNAHLNVSLGGHITH